MKKLFGTVSIIIIAGFISIVKTSAFTLSPASGTLNKGGSATISIIAAPSGTANALEVHIIVPTGMTVTNYTTLTSGPNIGSCTGAVHFLANEICSALGHSSNLTNGQVLATFTITSSTNGTYDLTAGSGAKYSNNQAVTGTLGTYTVSDSGQTLPTTSVFSNENKFLWFGGFLIMLGLTIIQIRRSDLSFNLNFNLSSKLKKLKEDRKKTLEESNQKDFENRVLRRK